MADFGWGDIQLGRLTLRETFTAAETGGDSRTLSLEGQESNPPRTRADVVAVHDSINALDPGVPIAVTFTDKPERDGYYQVKDASSTYTEYKNDMVTATWKINLERLGTASEVDLQSRLTGTVRSNDFSLSGERWHAAPIGHYAYYTGSSNPTSMTRTGADGAITVYRSVPANTSPRWGCAAGDYLDGRARILDGTTELDGTDRPVSATGWVLTNGLIKVIKASSGTNTLDVQAYTGGAWHSKLWDTFATSGTLITSWDAATILRNDCEMCILRLSKGLSPGRLTLDLTLRRGSRFVEGYLQRGTSADELKVRLATAETNNTSLAASGYVTATNNDADGNRFAAGSARSFTGHANGGVAKSTTTTLDFWLGIVAAGGSAVSGDAATDLRNQYIGCLAESTYSVRR